MDFTPEMVKRIAAYGTTMLTTELQTIPVGK